MSIFGAVSAGMQFSYNIYCDPGLCLSLVSMFSMIFALFILKLLGLLLDFVRDFATRYFYFMFFKIELPCDCDTITLFDGRRTLVATYLIVLRVWPLLRYAVMASSLAGFLSLLSTVIKFDGCIMDTLACFRTLSIMFEASICYWNDIFILEASAAVGF